MYSLPVAINKTFGKLRSRHLSFLFSLSHHKEHNLQDFSRQLHSVTETRAMTEDSVGLSLTSVVQKLTKFAPLSLAESWDNVGLLVEPSSPKQIKKIFLTNDLTERVLDEAIALNADLIISYHPPIFVPMKSLTTRTWKERIIVKCIENKIAVFSPHTSHDSVYGGVNDWMASTFVDAVVAPLTPASGRSLYSHQVEIVFPNSPAGNSEANEFQKRLRQYVDGCGEEPVCDLRDLSVKEMKMTVPCTESALAKVVKIFNDTRSNSEDGHLRITNYTKVPLPLCGTGRMCTLKQPIPLVQVVEAVKAKIGLPHVRLALAGKDIRDPVRTVAICVGSGTSVLRGVKADLYLTGEMLHHDVLDAVHNGSHVILCNHSDSERGFLLKLAQMLTSDFNGAVDIFVSEEDKDPLIVV